MLRGGGNALDAAVAANLALGVVVPYLCGYGGDLFAMVWRDGVHAYNGSGRAPAGADAERLRALAGRDELPRFGPLTVTVPGAVEAWFSLLERFGTRSFAELSAPAVRLAREGFTVSARAASSFARARGLYGDEHEWGRLYGGIGEGSLLRQPELARTIETLGERGPDAYYRGAIAEAIAETLRARGAPFALEDLAEHRGDWLEPLGIDAFGVRVLELPPNTQGVAALEALAIADGLSLGAPGTWQREHLQIEAIKRALADRDRYVSDPDAMTLSPEELLTPAWVGARRSEIEAARASAPAAARPARGGTAYLCAADADGMLVSLIQSNYVGFGSGVTVLGWGINLHNRGSYFSLDPGHVNVVAPRKRTLHTLIPAMALRGGRPWLVFGTMGGDGQAQTHLQLLTRLARDGMRVQEAIDAPRWVVDTRSGVVTVEHGFAPGIVDGLRTAGHAVRGCGPLDSSLGHAHAIVVRDGGYEAGSDPRSEGAARGF